MSTFGFPDWQAGANRRSVMLLQANGVALGTSSTPIGTVTITNYAYLVSIIAPSSTNNIQVGLTFDQEAGGIVGIRTYRLRSGILSTTSYLTPSLGATCAIDAMRATGAAASLTAAFYASDVPYLPTGLNGDILASGTVGPLATNGTGLVNVAPYEGWATVWVSSTQNNFIARVRGKDLDDVTLRTRTFYSNPSGPELAQASVWIPPYLCDVAVTNLNAAAATITVIVTAQPWAGH